MSVGSPLNVDGGGRDLVAGDVALGVGWGDGALVKSLRAGSNRSGGCVTVTSVGSNQALATATVTITFPEAFPRVPVCAVSRDATEESTDADTVTKAVYVKSITATAVVLSPDTIPVATKKFGFAYHIAEV